jgi:hypothetical protein
MFGKQMNSYISFLGLGLKQQKLIVSQMWRLEV